MPQRVAARGQTARGSRLRAWLLLVRATPMGTVPTRSVGCLPPKGSSARPPGGAAMPASDGMQHCRLRRGDDNDDRWKRAKRAQ
ncbi:hypothetical protein B296_00043318, partial [Ensete ventricosum]